MEIHDPHGRGVWITVPDPPDIVMGVDYWFGYSKGNVVIDNNKNTFNCNKKLIDKIARPRKNGYGEESKYYWDFNNHNLKYIKISNDLEPFDMHFEKMTFSDDEDCMFVLRGTNGYYTVNSRYSSKSQRLYHEKPTYTLAVIHEFIKQLNSIIY